MLYQVVAMANNRVIGKDNKLPWRFSSDLKFFKQLTMGQTIIMGRKTFESIGKPLPGRENFVVSHCHSRESGNLDPRLKHMRLRRSAAPLHSGMTAVRYFDSIENAIKAVATENCFIIGGSSLFKETMPLVDGIYLTRIHADYEGDTFYPEIPNEFKEKSKTFLQENPKLEVLFLTNQKKKRA